MAVIVSLFAFLSTLAGGWIALRPQRRPYLIVAFSAGAVIGVALFDLAPEAIALAGTAFSPAHVTAFIAAGFLGYMILQRLVASVARAGTLGAASLSIHSYLDGLSIGVGFAASTAVGVVVSIAVVVHDLCDGINTVTVVRRNDGSVRTAWRWLVVDAVAPIVGAASASFLRFSDSTMGLALAVFAGFFLYIGASDLLPASARLDPSLATAAMTLLGAALLFTAVRLAGL